MSIYDYLLNHTIIRIGNCLSEYVCCETIVDNPIELIAVVKENDCYISEIRWWDRVKISLGSKIGYGGAKDPRFPDEYFFAETDICRVFDFESCDGEYYEYLEQIKQKYANYDLFPAFDIKKKI